MILPPSLRKALEELEGALGSLEKEEAARTLRALARQLEDAAQSLDGEAEGSAEPLHAESRRRRRPAGPLAGEPSAFAAHAPPAADDDSLFVANGIYADTGLPLCQFQAREAQEILFGASYQAVQAEEHRSKAKIAEDEDHYGVVGDVDASDLASAGWGVVLAADLEDPETYLGALAPLLEHREKQAGSLFRVFKGEDGVQWQEQTDGSFECESSAAWLARHNVAAGAVDPRRGVPYYLLLVGSPHDIPFEFQYELDIFWGVGRVCFGTPADLRAYAEAVVRYETQSRVEQESRVALFAPRHEADPATRKFVDLMAEPLSSGANVLGSSQGYELESFIAGDATKVRLSETLAGTARRANPALLFSGAHGLAMRPADGDVVWDEATGTSKLEAFQGSLVCQEWRGPTTEVGRVEPDALFAGHDLDDEACLDGIIHFNFACYGAGWPEYETIARRGHEPQRVAPEAGVSSLPQQMLRRGALASLGHVDKSWPSAFEAERAGPQPQHIRDVLDRLLQGERVGQATDAFDQRKAQLTFELFEKLTRFGLPNVDHEEVAGLFTAREDAKSYVVLGDPAVRLRVDSMRVSNGRRSHGD